MLDRVARLTACGFMAPMFGDGKTEASPRTATADRASRATLIAHCRATPGLRIRTAAVHDDDDDLRDTDDNALLDGRETMAVTLMDSSAARAGRGRHEHHGRSRRRQRAGLRQHRVGPFTGDSAMGPEYVVLTKLAPSSLKQGSASTRSHSFPAGVLGQTEDARGRGRNGELYAIDTTNGSTKGSRNFGPDSAHTNSIFASRRSRLLHGPEQPNRPGLQRFVPARRTHDLHQDERFFSPAST